ncbi:MAG: ATP-binding protein [bacterium]
MPRLTRYDGYAVAALAVAALTALLAPILDERHIVDVSLLYLLVTLVVAARWGYGVGIFTAIAADLCVNFFYIPPLHRFTVQEPVNLAGLVLFLCVALFGAYMLSRLREQAANARAREAETAFLLGATREIVRAETPRQALDRLCEVLARAANARGCAILSGPSLTIAGATIDEPSSAPATRDDIAVAKEVFRTDRPARITAAPGRKPARTVTFVPLHSTGVPALLRLVGDIPNKKLESAVVQALVNEASAALERARLSREAERANALERADEFKNVLLSSVSHDLRSPLTAIKAAVSSLRDESVDWSADDRRSFLETIESQSDRLTRTVSNLLEMSRLEGGTVRPSLEAIEVSLLFEDISLAVAPTLGARKFVVSGPPGVWVRADYGLLTQAITNLIENAVKYSVPAGPICLDAHGAPGRVLISVSDSGPGIPPEDLPHLFEKFYRGKHVGTVIGTGLGLALVRAMVELCGGSVSVDSAPAGTRFTLSLPSTVAPQ